MQRTGASRFAQRQINRHRRLAPVVDLIVGRWHFLDPMSVLHRVAEISLALGILATGLVVASCGRKGDSVRAGSQVRAVSVAIERYIQTHGGRLPPFENRQQLEVSLLNGKQGLRSIEPVRRTYRMSIESDFVERANRAASEKRIPISNTRQK